MYLSKAGRKAKAKESAFRNLLTDLHMTSRVLGSLEQQFVETAVTAEEDRGERADRLAKQRGRVEELQASLMDFYERNLR